VFAGSRASDRLEEVLMVRIEFRSGEGDSDPTHETVGRGASPSIEGGRLLGARQRRAKSRCRVPTSRSLLLPYLLSQCSEDQAITLEAHLLACATCFQDLKSLDRAAGVIHELMDTTSPARDQVLALLGGQETRRLLSRRAEPPRAT
jgi:hypothetical protein